MLRSFLYVLASVIFLFAASQAQAACTSPARAEGAIVYNDDENILQYCDDTTWIALHASVPGSGTSCSFPPRAEGALMYNADENIPQVCAGGTWVALGLPDSSAGSGGCTSPSRAEGTLLYNADENVIQYCDGNTWQRAFGPNTIPDCPDFGDTCADGTVYAGITPDGDVRMYVTICDVGMSWSGSNCTGARTTLPWNNDNATGYVATGFNSDTTGDTNTAGLAFADSDSITGGDQPHQAALYCHCLGDSVAGECAGDPTSGASGYGHSDWYLPAWDELDVIYEHLQDGWPNDNNPDPPINSFTTDWYWASTDYGGSPYARTQNFNDGDQSNANPNKRNDYPVRCARHD